MKFQAAASATLWRLLHLISTRPGAIAASSRDKPTNFSQFGVRVRSDVNGACKERDSDDGFADGRIRSKSSTQSD